MGGAHSVLSVTDSFVQRAKQGGMNVRDEGARDDGGTPSGPPGGVEAPRLHHTSMSHDKTTLRAPTRYVVHPVSTASGLGMCKTERPAGPFCSCGAFLVEWLSDAQEESPRPVV